MNLLDLQIELLKKYDEMKKGDAGDNLAAPFLSEYGGNSSRHGVGPILLVGKATRGHWRLDEFRARRRIESSVIERVDERKKATKDHLMNSQSKPNGAFWRFWKRLSDIGSPVIWTNLAKIGAVDGNPSSDLLNCQSELCVQILRAELAEYKPSLIVLVSSDYAKEEIVYKLWPPELWRVSKFDGTCWIERKISSPPVLWTDHPQGKDKVRVNFWLSQAERLVENS